MPHVSANVLWEVGWGVEKSHRTYGVLKVLNVKYLLKLLKENVSLRS